MKINNVAKYVMMFLNYVNSPLILLTILTILCVTAKFMCDM